MYEAYVDGALFYSTAADDEAFAVSSTSLKQEINKAGSFECTVMPSNQCYGKFQQMKSVIECYRDGALLFYGRVTETSTDINRKKKIYAEGAYGYLLDSVQTPQDGVKLTPTELLNKLLAAHNEQVEDYKKFTLRNITIAEKDTSRSWDIDGDRTQEALENMLLDLFSGYFMVGRLDDGTNYLDYLAEPTDVLDQPIEVGLNMIDLNDKEESSDLFTVLRPLGDNNITIESVAGTPYIESAEKVEKYGRIVKSLTFNKSTAADLYTAAQAYMAKWCQPPARTVTMNAVDLATLGYSYERFKMGTKVRAISDMHDLDVTLYCKAITCDLQQDHKSSVSLTDRLDDDSDESTSSSSSAASTKRSSSSSGSGGGSFFKDKVSQCFTNTNNILRMHEDEITINASKTLNLEAEVINIGKTVDEVQIDLDNAKVNINDDLVDIRSDIVNVKKAYIADLDATKSDITWLHSLSITCHDITAIGGTSYIKGNAVIQGRTLIQGQLNIDTNGGSFVFLGNKIQLVTKTIEGTAITYLGRVL